MTGAALAGVVAAWSLTHAALGAYFILAFVLGRREREFLLFSLMCFALSITSAGIALDYVSVDPQNDLDSDILVHVGAIPAAALNVHFAMEFARVRRATRIAVALYALVVIFEIGNIQGLLWSAHHDVVVEAFGDRIEYAVGQLTPFGYSFYAIGLAESIASVTLLIVAYRSGRREALSALIGAALCLPAIVNDAGIATGMNRETVSLLPHGFLVYAFGVAATLLLRYRVATGELERAAATLRERTAELADSHAELRQIQEELTSKKQLAAVGELAAAIAHEVRNPLAVIVNAVAGLRRGNLREEARTNLLDIVEEEAGRLNRLVGDLLRFARPVSVNRLPVSLVELANRARGSLREPYELSIETDGSPECETVWVDPNLFRLVIDNLISNARQAMRDGGTIRVRVRKDPAAMIPSVRLEIQDKGRGMGADVRRRATDPFFTTRPSGTGLGLPIVVRIIEAHGGTLTIESSEGAGTTVSVSVPIGRHAPEADTEVVRVLP
ncbi:MAG TPA: ATP-binding protein [Polyangiaceae bacterium]|nr:ATP-binding protein [Polyangiaceae bacterium]